MKTVKTCKSCANREEFNYCSFQGCFVQNNNLCDNHSDNYITDEEVCNEAGYVD